VSQWSKHWNYQSAENRSASCRTPATGDPTEVIAAHARSAAAYMPFLEPDSLMAPKLPTKEEMENVLLELRKRALVDEYLGTRGGRLVCTGARCIVWWCVV